MLGKLYDEEAKIELNICSWPGEFSDPRPQTTFGDQLTSVLEPVVSSGGTVTVIAHWAKFTCKLNNRLISFTRRGSFGRRGWLRKQRFAWQVRVGDGGQPIDLGPLFGRTASTSVVVTKFTDVRRLTKLWLFEEESLQALIDNAEFWDSYDRKFPLTPRRLNPKQMA